MDQYKLAEENMVNWLSFPEELGKAPDLIECTKRFSYNNMFYYIFKFKKDVTDEKWILGVSGGYEENAVEPCGHTFSDRKEYIKEREEEDAITSIEMIINYWKARTQQIAKKNNNKGFSWILAKFWKRT